jgi:glycosyltransferase involved in cell wall biosynthesis
MKILFFHRWVGVHSGGTETHIKELVLLLAKKGHQIDILTREGDELKDLPSEIKIWRVSKNYNESDHSYDDSRVYYHTFLFMVKSLIKLLYLRLVKGIRYDIISVHFVTEAEVARIYRIFFGTPYVFVLEGYTPLEGKRASKADAQIAISMHEFNECFRNHGYKPRYIPKGLDSLRFNTEIDGSVIRKMYCRAEEKMILTVGRIEPRKGYPTLIQAAKNICSHRSDIKFIIVGDGIDFSKIKNDIERLELSKNIIMVGNIDYFSQDLPRYYRAADLFVLPTIYEGFGYVYCEAMACGLPVISTNVGAVPEVLGEAGIIIPPRDPDLLAEKILFLLENENLRKEMSQRGIERVRSYDWDRQILLYEDAYKSVLKK